MLTLLEVRLGQSSHEALRHLIGRAVSCVCFKETCVSLRFKHASVGNVVVTGPVGSSLKRQLRRGIDGPSCPPLSQPATVCTTSLLQLSHNSTFHVSVLEVSAKTKTEIFASVSCCFTRTYLGLLPEFLLEQLAWGLSYAHGQEGN